LVELVEAGPFLAFAVEVVVPGEPALDGGFEEGLRQGRDPPGIGDVLRSPHPVVRRRPPLLVLGLLEVRKDGEILRSLRRGSSLVE